MTATIVLIWLVSTFVLTAYHLLIFNRKVPSIRKTVPGYPGISILIAHRSHSRQLMINLPFILGQEYPEFEIIIVDDHSNPEDLKTIQTFIQSHEQIRLIRNEGYGKKAALMTGVRSARHDVILCTDADCRPDSTLWMKSMESVRKGNAYVLGYSPHTYRPGLLSSFIRFETIMTAVQYFSWANIGKPYMGVGRNLLFRKEAFLENDPFKNNAQIIYGDDDTLVQKFSGIPVSINLNPNAYVMTDAPPTLDAWLKQKHRHLSAAKNYRFFHWLKPGLYGMAMVIHWIILPLIMVYVPVANWLPVMLIAIIIRWAVFSRWKGWLHEKKNNWPYFLMEPFYAIYLAVMGMKTTIQSKKQWN